MRMTATTVVQRMLTADPARAISVDETARLQLLQRLASEPRQRRAASWRDRVRRWLCRPLILIPAVVLLSGAAVGTEPAWCAPCAGSANPAKTSSSVPRSPSWSAVAPPGTRFVSGAYEQLRADTTANRLARRNPA
jgi:hypothetical protein